MAKVKVCDISGMGGREKGGYEWGCQVIALRTLRFLQSQPKDSVQPSYKQSQNIVGLKVTSNPKAEEMDKYVCDHPVLHENGTTGAMHQFGTNHGQKIFELGRDEYLRQLAESRPPEDFYEFEEDDAFPPDEVAA